MQSQSMVRPKGRAKSTDAAEVGPRPIVVAVLPAGQGGRHQANRPPVAGATRSVLLSGDIVADVTGLPLTWFAHLRDPQRLSIPFYALGNAGVIRFSLEKVFRWEMTRLVPRALPLVNAGLRHSNDSNASALT